MFNSLLPISPRRALLFCLSLSLFEMMTYLGSDVVMPAMLTIVGHFHADAIYVPWAFNAYLLGGVAFQWLIGPISDRFGRRVLLLIGSAGFALALLITPWVTNIQLFILLRFIQGIALGFVVVVSLPALQEAFKEADAIRLIALFSNIALLSPLFGPLLGSLLISLVSWQTLFFSIAIISVLVWFGLIFSMPETLGVVRSDGSKLEYQPLKLSSIANNYVALLKNRRVVSGSVALGLCGLPLMAWIAFSPLLLVNYLGMSITQYALWQLPLFCALILGNIMLNFIVEKFRVEQLLAWSLLPIFSGLIFALIVTLVYNNFIALVAGLACYAFGLSVYSATLYRITLFSSDHGKGAVSAIIGMVSTLIYAGGNALFALGGSGDNLRAYILPSTLAALVALIPLGLGVYRSQRD